MHAMTYLAEHSIPFEVASRYGSPQTFKSVGYKAHLNTKVEVKVRVEVELEVESIR